MKHHLLAGAAATATALAAQAQTAPAPTLPEVAVQAGRLELRAFDTPGSVHVVDEAAIRAAGPQVNLSEALAGVPGVVSLNRNNYAQDLQVSIRGFGARAAFGLRGLRLVVDGIPASTPDGQGQASTVALSSAGRIEVLAGPLAQIHGNASGGVIQAFTREAGAQPEGQAQATQGSFGLRRSDWQASGRAGPGGRVGIVADFSEFETDGWRDNSAARRRHFNGVVTVDAQPGTRVRLVANLFDMPLAQDPLGLTASQLATPSAAGTNAVARATRKVVSQEQLGAVVEHRLSSSLRLQGRVYGGERENLQFQAGNTWVGLARRFDGVGLQLDGKARLGGDTAVDWVAGFDRERAGEQRQGGPAAAGEKTGAIDRNEWNQSGNRDVFVQAHWRLGGHWTLTTGARRSDVTLRSRDDYLADGRDGSGSVRHRATQPVLGLTWHATDTLNLYVNHGKGFETPTLAEAAYTVAGTAVVGSFNTRLAAARSRHLEAGAKWAAAPATRLDLAVFRIDTEDEIVSALSAGGRTAFANATSTVRQGLEASLRQAWSPHWRALASASLIRATYDTAFSGVPAGNRLPGVPARQAFGSLQWSQRGLPVSGKPPAGLEAALDWTGRSRLWANDANTASAPGHGLLNLRMRHRWQVDAASVEAFGGIDNLADRRTIGSVIVNQASGGFYEPGLPRSWVLGVQVKVPL
ncbi:TonB-dependent receptor family protein [Ramlibacter sp. MAHUQ-53]|uniref:TonB-dependent receptor family protein n=1 Tax=unclassified Ramlibacter TaxID=2617605 RepID=UPI00362777A3